MLHPIKALQYFMQGQSYWRVVLINNRVWSQLDTVYDPLRGKPEHKYQRALDWYLDIIATGDHRRIAELWLHSPTGDVALRIDEPGTAYQLNAAGLLLDMGAGATGRQRDGQIIGRVEDRDTGNGTAFIWDVHMRQMFKAEQEMACVRNFPGWRPGIAALGALAIKNLGLAIEE